MRDSDAERALARLIGDSAVMGEVRRLAATVAPSTLPVLVTGETGTGKELVAEAIHAGSERSGRFLIKVNCAAMQDTLIESELFGHEKGSFTGADHRHIGAFERADGGTLFLDEVGDLSHGAQAKILRALQNGVVQRVGGSEPIPVDVRVVTATNRPLAAMIGDGRFRADLYYRLTGITIDVPPLRARIEDVPALAEHFLARAGRPCRLSPAAVDAINRHEWAGNVRELENAIHRAAVLASDGLILPSHLQLEAAPAVFGRRVVELPPHGCTLADIEREAVLQALRHAQWSQKRAAELLGISGRVLSYKVNTLGLHDEFVAKSARAQTRARAWKTVTCGGCGSPREVPQSVTYTQCMSCAAGAKAAQRREPERLLGRTS